MPSSFALLLLAGMAVGEDQNTRCFENYAQGWQAARLTRRPMLVILNPGEGNGKEPIELEDVRKTAETRQLLDDYVVVMVDTESDYGKAVYKAFREPELPRVVVIDKNQQVQLYKTSRPLYGQLWTAVLKTYRNGERHAALRPAYGRRGAALQHGAYYRPQYPQFQFCPT